MGVACTESLLRRAVACAPIVVVCVLAAEARPTAGSARVQAWPARPASRIALGAGTAAKTKTPSGGTLRVVAPFDVGSLDPALSNPRSAPIEQGTCATLMAFRDRSGPSAYTTRPEAASGPPRVSRDGRTYVFTVRKGLRFSDGSPLRPANFALALRRVLNPAMRSYGADLFPDVKRVSASGDRLRIELRKPSGDLSTRLALPFACPVPLGFPVDPAGVPLMVGSGPYYVAQHLPGKLLVVERNRYYRGPRPHRIDRLVLTVGGDLRDNIRAIEEGRADVLGFEIPREIREELVQRYGVNKRQLFRIRGTFVGALVLNTSRPLFRDNVALRKAINLAVDRREIVRSGGGPSSFTATDQILPRWIPGWQDRRLYPLAGPNLTFARRLADGNLRDGKAVLYTSRGPGLVDQADVIVRNLHEIGLDVAVKVLAIDVENAKAGTPGEPYDMLLSNFFPDYPDPANMIIRLLGGENARKPAGNTNYAYFDVPAYNRRMAAANRLSGAPRFRAFSKLDADIMRAQAPWAPLFEGSGWVFMSKRIGCFKPHPIYRMDYLTVCFR